MLEEALPIAVGVGAALLPAMAFGGIAAARAFIYLAAADSGVLQALEEGKSEEEALKLAEGGAIASPLERPRGAAMPALLAPVGTASARAAAVVIASPMERVAAASRPCSYGFAAARFVQ